MYRREFFLTRSASLNGERIYLFDELSTFLHMNKEKPITIVYERQGQQYETRTNAVYDETDGRYYLGIVCADMVRLKGMDGIRYAWYEVRAGVKNTYKRLVLMVTGQVKRTEVAGPVGIANMVGDIYEETKESWLDVLVNMMNITMLLSVNLGILNLLPLPALDGGRLVFAGTKQECLDGEILEKTFSLKRYTVGEEGKIFFSAE